MSGIIERLIRTVVPEMRTAAIRTIRQEMQNAQSQGERLAWLAALLFLQGHEKVGK